MSLGTVLIVNLLSTNDAGNSPPLNGEALQAMLFMVGVFTFMLWSLTFKLNKTICSLFFLLGVTCILLSFGVHNETVDTVGGYFGILTSANAFWLAYAELVNDVIGEGKREIIPLGHWHWNEFKESGGAHVPGRIRGHRVSVLDLKPTISASKSLQSPEPEVVIPETPDLEQGVTDSEDSQT